MTHYFVTGLHNIIYFALQDMCTSGARILTDTRYMILVYRSLLHPIPPWPQCAPDNKLKFFFPGGPSNMHDRVGGGSVYLWDFIFLIGETTWLPVQLMDFIIEHFPTHCSKKLFRVPPCKAGRQETRLRMFTTPPPFPQYKVEPTTPVLI